MTFPTIYRILALYDDNRNEDDSMSHREGGFRGGIQSGMVATDAVAAKLDKQCKLLKEELSEVFEGTGLTMQKKLLQSQIPGGIGACEPDGGAWFYNGKLVAIFEAKKQGKRGNAIERWFKNNYICKAINNDVCYVTFCTGEGAGENEVLQKTLNIAHLDGFNQFNPNKNSAFFSVKGFTTEEVSDIMKTVLEYCIEND